MITEKQKKAWIAALRSGEFKQGERQLEDYTNRFCCLGVYGKINEIEYTKDWSFLKVHIKDTDGLLSATYPYIPYPFQCICATLNDEFMWSFNRIADFIELQSAEAINNWSKPTIHEFKNGLAQFDHD